MRFAVTAAVLYAFLIVVRAEIGNAVDAGAGCLSENPELVVVLDVRHQSDVLGDKQCRAESLELLCLVLGLPAGNEVVIPKLRTALDLCYMCLYTVQIRMHVVVDLEALLTAGLAADAVPVRKFLGLEQIDFRSADRTFVSHDNSPLYLPTESVYFLFILPARE